MIMQYNFCCPWWMVS